jgi:hypothetical protein
MTSPASKTLRLAVLTVGLLFCGIGAFAQNASERLAAYEAAISSGDPAAAAAFLSDRGAKDLAAVDGQKAAFLTAKAEALKDLEELLDMPWGQTKSNKLNQALAIRMDADKPLAKAGIGPEPEKLLGWLEKYQPSYPARKKEVVKKAIRQWDIVFGTAALKLSMPWGMSSDHRDTDGNLIRRGNVTVTKDAWAAMPIRERNSVITQLMLQVPSFMVYDDGVLSSSRDHMELLRSVNKVKSSGALTPAQLSQLSGKSFSDQIYLLGSFFDGGAAKGDEDISRIHAARGSLPKEVLPSQQRALLGGMLGPAVSKELAGTMAGKKILAFHYGVFPFHAKEGPLKIEVRPCDGTYSGYDPSAKTILLDSETIQQYMRMKGYTADSLMRNKEQVAEIAKYMSPAVVYESAHQMQDSWAKGQGVYKPHVQEDEIEAMALEGLYTGEKLRKDAAFKEIMDGSRDFSSYAAKRVEVATEYGGSGSKKFSTTVRQIYFSGLPSLDAAASQVLGAVSGELSRRAALTAAEREGNDAVSLNLAEAMEMTPGELAGSVGEIRTDALAKIEKDLSGLGIYKRRYSASDRESRKALKNLETGPTDKTSVPPAL